MINIYSASAGAGKTYTLTGTYLKMLLSYKVEGGRVDPTGFRHILAVTFTNKATDEMKTRILSELNVLATDVRNSHYYREFVTDGALVPQYYPDEDALCRAARSCLVALLHDYGSFSISTIDRFVQMTLKAFCREIGQLASYRVELDRESLIAECVDRILDSIDREAGSGILDWMVRASRERLEDGKRVNVDDIMLEEALKIKSESHRNAVEKLSAESAAALYSAEKTAAVRNALKTFADETSAKMRSLVSESSEALGQSGLSVDDFKANVFKKFLSDCAQWRIWQNLPVVNKTSAEAYAGGPQKWFKVSDAAKAAMVTPRLENAIGALIDFCCDADFERVYSTLRIVKSHLFAFELASRVNSEYDALAKEKNVLDISDSNTTLREIIAGSDAPFVYERIGVRYEHFLLDEFQDTSRIQWKNFYPLLKESCSNGNDNLIVGDIKQSIYRFRDTDWTLLGSEVRSSFRPDQTTVLSLADNHRSGSRIVGFNNTFFPKLADALELRLQDVAGPSSADMDLRTIYSASGVFQNVKKSFPGAVKAVFCDPELEDRAVLQCVIRAHDDLGFAYKDITVLVRGRKGGERASAVLTDAGINVITDDSLSISSSVAVRKIVSLMSAVNNPSDKIRVALSHDLGVDTADRNYISIYDLAESLVRDLAAVEPELIEEESLYIQDFMDFLQDFEARESGSLHLFLREWDARKDKLKVCSSKGTDAVTIMTVHKSKGLAAPYVIVAYLEDFELSHSSQTRWCTLSSGNPGIDDCMEGVYDVKVEDKASLSSCMGAQCREELRLQYIDNLNILYVAFTRSRQALCMIGRDAGASKPRRETMSEVVREYLEAAGQFKVEGEGQNMMRVWICDDDEPCFYPDDVRDDGSAVEELPCNFVSWELSSKKVSDVSRDMEFFSEEDAGTSPRRRGVILHDILSSVRIPSDLDEAVDSAVASGELAADESEAARQLLARRLESASLRGWFPTDSGALVLNETEILSPSGEYSRPDRVVLTDGGVMIIDYKFGRPRSSYMDQVRGYAQLYCAMGYTVKGAYLWYVADDSVVEVDCECRKN